MNTFVKVEECDDTDSNKTEVEEIEMVDMEGRAEVQKNPKPKQTKNNSIRNPHLVIMILY